MAPAHVKSSAATVGAGERAKPSTSDTSVVTAHRACAALYTLARCLLGARVQVGARPEIVAVACPVLGVGPYKKNAYTSCNVLGSYSA